MDLPLVSVIIPSYNSARTIEKCLKSIKTQSYANIEIIVVDNYSSDDTPQIASQFAKVIQAGPERSAQVNVGVREARGKYVYRVDSDFELDASLIETSANQMEANGLDALVIPNRSVGSSYWARVRALERDTYLDDSLMVAARFWKREVFLGLGGLDENLIACEDLDFHNRLLENGCQIGRLPEAMAEVHLGESDQLGAYAQESFYYGPSILRYLRKNPRRGIRQSIPLRPSFLKHWKSFLRRPGLVPGFLILKITQTLFSLLGMLTESLGLSGDRGQLSGEVAIGLGFVVISSLGLLDPLAALGFQANPTTGILAILAGCVIWQAAGKRIATQESVPRKKALLSTAVAYSPLFGILLFSLSGDRSRWGELNVYLPALLLALWAGWLSYLSQIHPGGRNWSRLATGLVVAGALLFAALLSWRSILRLQSFLESGFNLATYDQALWRTAESLRSGLNVGPLLFSSISGRSLLADSGAPILFFWVPLYWAGIGGPALLCICQWIAIATNALVLFKRGNHQIGAVTSALVCLAFLGYLVTQQIGLGAFTPLSFGAPLILLAWDAYLHRRRIAFLLLCILALSCGIEMGLVVSMLGLSLLLIRPARRQDGWLILALGLGWTWVGSMVLAPYFGGTAGEFFSPYLPPANTPALEYYLARVFSIQALAYGFKSMAPLAFLPIFGLVAWIRERKNRPGPEAVQSSIELPFLLLALPRLFLNLCGQGPWYTSLNGEFELTTLPFFFAAAIDVLARLQSRAKPGRKPAGFAVSSFVFAGCLGTTLFFGTPLFNDLSTLRIGLHQQVGQAVIRQIPDSASVSAQNPLSIPLAHRFELSILPSMLPGGNNPDYILMDVFNPNRDPDPGQYHQALWQALNNPEYRLELADNGYLLFKLGESGGFKNNIGRLALTPDPGRITFPNNIDLDHQVAFLGMDLSSTEVRANETFYLTTYWKCLAPVSKPYLSFIAYPGSRRFEDYVLGFYPPTEWIPGQVIRQEQAISLPNVPDGDRYELVAGMWFDSGEPKLISAEQLLGKDVIRLASISAHGGQFKIIPRPVIAGP